MTALGIEARDRTGRAGSRALPPQVLVLAVLTGVTAMMKPS
jgi:hypothetical protein